MTDQKHMDDQRHRWSQSPVSLTLMCERCCYTVSVAMIARSGWDPSSEDDIYWALGGNDLFSNGCCPRRVN